MTDAQVGDGYERDWVVIDNMAAAVLKEAKANKKLEAPGTARGDYEKDAWDRFSRCA
jgi:hypothetical protein